MSWEGRRVSAVIGLFNESATHHQYWSREQKQASRNSALARPLSKFRRSASPSPGRCVQVSLRGSLGKKRYRLTSCTVHVFRRTGCFQQRDRQQESRYDLACLLRMPTKVAVVTKIDIQIRRSLSQLLVHGCFFFFFLFHGAELCGRKRMRRWRVGKKKKVEGFFSRAPYVVSFGEEGGRCCSLMSWLIPSVHGVCAPTWPSALIARPGTARCFAA